MEQWFSRRSYSREMVASSPVSNSMIVSFIKGLSPSINTLTLAVVLVSSWFSRTPIS